MTTDIFNELIKVHKMSEWKSKCIIGLIYANNGASLKRDQRIMKEEQFNVENEKKQVLGESNYLAYLEKRISRYII